MIPTDGSENRESPEDRGADEFRKGTGLLPGDVARGVLGSNPEGTESFETGRPQIAKVQRQIIATSGVLPLIRPLGSIDAKGTEHSVRFRGVTVEKHQHSDGWAPFLDKQGALGICKALPLEYLRRLELQNELFGDQVRVIGLTAANRFVTIQPTLRGGEPGELEIRDVLLLAGWRRVPIHLQNLPAQLMGSAWWQDEEGLVLIDAQNPISRRRPSESFPSI